jgi:hypothetical protein
MPVNTSGTPIAQICGCARCNAFSMMYEDHQMVHNGAFRPVISHEGDQLTFGRVSWATRIPQLPVGDRMLRTSPVMLGADPLSHPLAERNPTGIVWQSRALEPGGGRIPPQSRDRTINSSYSSFTLNPTTTTRAGNPTFIIRYEKGERISEIALSSRHFLDALSDAVDGFLWRFLTPSAYEELRNGLQVRWWRRPQWIVQHVFPQYESVAKGK